MSTTELTSTFAAVDLDAVLDDLENQEELEQKQRNQPQDDKQQNEQSGGDPREDQSQDKEEVEEKVDSKKAGEEHKNDLLDDGSEEEEEEQQFYESREQHSLTVEDASSEVLHANGSCEVFPVPDQPEDDVRGIETPPEMKCVSPTNLVMASLEGATLSIPIETRSTSSGSSSPPFESIYDSAPATEEEVEEAVEDELPSNSTEAVGGARPRSLEVAIINGSPPPYSEIDPMVVATDEASVSNESSAVVEQEVVTEQPVEEDDDQPNNVDDMLDRMLGFVSPTWLPDSEAPCCMMCGARFTLVKRRHHCRACGKVFCSNCCNDRAELPCMEEKVSRVCKACKDVLDRNRLRNMASPSSSLRGAEGGTPVVGVLKRFGVGSPSGASEEDRETKQVMFSDGIRPGGDLTELDGSSEYRSSSSRHRQRRSKRNLRTTAEVGKSLLPSEESGETLPRVLQPEGIGADLCIIEEMLTQARLELEFQVNKNLSVSVKLRHYAPIGKELWIYSSHGLPTVGQDEVVILLTRLNEDEALPRREIFEQYQFLYEQARAGNPALDMSYTSLLCGEPFLDGTDYGGFLYFRHTFQSLEGLDLMEPPFLFAVLLSKWEIPWARVFPLRLKLRLGAEVRYYPAPIWSVRDRPTVYKDIANTIMKLLCDFRNYSYSLPIIKGLLIHMQLHLTEVLIPKDRYRQIRRALLNSNEPVLALGSVFSTEADSHLVAVQIDDEHRAAGSEGMQTSDYETQAINIMNRPRIVTGASFIVFNGALKSSSGLTAKSSIVEDGIMVQVSQERMIEIRKSLEKMEDFEIKCGPIAKVDNPDEVVAIKWIDGNSALNPGVHSHITGESLEGISSIRLHASKDYVSENTNLYIRWTEVFLLKTDNSAEERSSFDLDPQDPMVAAAAIGKAVCMALTPQLKVIKEKDMTPFAVRVTLDPEQGSFDSLSRQKQFPPELLNCLDSALIPIIHGNLAHHRNCLELVFHVLDC